MGQLQERYKSYRRPQKYAELGIYPYFRAITSKQGTEVEMDGHPFRRKKVFNVVIRYIAPVFVLIILLSSIANAFGLISL